MKNVEFVVIFSLCIHFVCSSSINFVSNDAAAVEADNKPYDEETLGSSGSDTSGPTVEIWETRLRGSPFEDLKEDAGKEIESRNLSGFCEPISCMQLCSRLGFRFFRCDFTRCICWNR